MKLAIFNLHLNIHRLGCVLERGGSRSSVGRGNTQCHATLRTRTTVSDAISISGKGLTPPPPLEGKGARKEGRNWRAAKVKDEKVEKLKFGWNESTYEMHIVFVSNFEKREA